VEIFREPSEVADNDAIEKLVADKFKQPKAVADTVVTVKVPPDKLVVEIFKEPREVTVTVVPDCVVAVQVALLIFPVRITPVPEMLVAVALVTINFKPLRAETVIVVPD
jgi:hypothetical protein